jgi:para-nitrobenzyl esterase
MAHAWASFIRSGNPSTDLLDWPSFTPQNRNVMVFDDEILVKEDPLAPYRETL